MEPGNAVASGVDIPELQVRLSAGRPVLPLPAGRSGVRTHGVIAVLLGTALQNRRQPLFRQMIRAALGLGEFRGSAEQLTPVLHDPLSALPAVLVCTRLLLSPDTANSMAANAVSSYSVGPDAIAKLAQVSRRKNDGKRNRRQGQQRRISKMGSDHTDSGVLPVAVGGIEPAGYAL